MTITNEKIKIAYLVVMRSFPGLIAQRRYEREVCSQLEGVIWENFTFLDGLTDSREASPIPGVFRGVLGRKLFAWFWLLKNANRYDFVVVRHMEFDPFALIFARFVRNRITVHHSKEVIELLAIRKDWRGRLASALERLSGRVAVRNACGLMAVTNEVRLFQKSARCLPEDFPSHNFPNGIAVNQVAVLKDNRSSESYQIAFVAGTFAPWHGLDVLLEVIESFDKLKWRIADITLHLIGSVPHDYDEQIRRINDGYSPFCILVHGRKEQAEYRQLLDRCDGAIGSLAMHRIELTEGSTLKVREMLALGLPVFSGHVDTAIPKDFPYMKVASGEWNLLTLIDFLERHRKTSREEVRQAATPYIDKMSIMTSAAEFLRGIYIQSNSQSSSKSE